MAAPVEAVHRVTGPVVIALRPPAAAIAGQEGGDEALAHLGFAIDALRRCLRGAPVRFETVEADRLVLQDGPRRRTVAFGPVDDGLAVVLTEPGRPPQVVRSGVGPSALAHQAQQAAWTYWRARRCRPG
jgi:hypothetical protein